MIFPKVSVILPVYNAERYIQSAVNSILAQDFHDFEFLILDDGSSDKSLDFLRILSGQDSRIKLMSRKNSGLVATLNELLKIARGDYIARMDADDISLPNRLSRQVEVLDCDPDLAVVGSSARFIDPDGLPIMDWNVPLEHDSIDADHFYNRACRIVHPSVMMRREMILSVGGYLEDYPYAEDLDLWLRLGEVAKLKNIKDILIEYRHHPNSVSYSNRLIQSKSVDDAIRHAAQRRSVPIPSLDPVRRAADLSIAKSEADQYILWGYWALSSGHLGTARLYAPRILGLAPFRRESWLYLVVVIRSMVGSFIRRFIGQ